MKLLIFGFLLYSFQSIACSENYLKNATDTEKFLAVVESSPVVFVGEVIRLYRTLGAENFQKAKNGFVLKVIEPINGSLSPYIEMERGWHCGVNSPYQDGYWPEKVGQKFIIAGRLEQKGPYTFEFANAVYPHSEDLTFMQKVYAAANKSMKKGT